MAFACTLLLALVVLAKPERPSLCACWRLALLWPSESFPTASFCGIILSFALLGTII
jgi:hypothetical protein